MRLNSAACVCCVKLAIRPQAPRGRLPQKHPDTQAQMQQHYNVAEGRLKTPDCSGVIETLTTGHLIFGSNI